MSDTSGFLSTKVMAECLNEVNEVDGKRAARDEDGGNSFGCAAVFEETASMVCSVNLFIGFRQCSISKIRALNGCMVEYTGSPMICSNRIPLH